MKAFVTVMNKKRSGDKEILLRPMRIQCMTAAVAAAWLTSAAAQDFYDLNIPSTTVAEAVKSLSQQTGRSVLFQTDHVTTVDTNALYGRYTVEQALDALLNDTSLSGGLTQSGVITISLVNGNNREEAPMTSGTLKKSLLASVGVLMFGAAHAQDVERVEEDEKQEVDNITVTGTSIRGVYPKAVPLESFEAAEIEAMGATTLEDFLFRLPGNLSNLTDSAPGATKDGLGDRNVINLRGLGTGATLVLINGRRLVAPGGASPDISLIPLAAIERVEVLSDGASAIYGSDAIAGVVNIILRDKADGAETGVSFGTVTEGGHRKTRADQSVGFNWDSGNIFLGYSFMSQTKLRGAERDFSQGLPEPYDLIPDDQRHSALFSFGQELSERTRLSGDFLFSDRDTNSEVSRTGIVGITAPLRRESRRGSKQIFSALGIEHDLNDNLRLDITGAYSRIETELSDFNGDGDFVFGGGGDATSLTATGKLDGDLIDLPAGAVKFSIGGGYAEEKFSAGSSKSKRDSEFAFGEVFVPLVAPEQGVPFVNRLEVTAATRHTNYSDFGGNTSPRFGVYLSPLEGIGLRGTYSKGFRAPSLATLNAFTNYSIFSPAAFGYPDPFSSDDSTAVLLAQGSNNPNIGPENSKSYTAGLDLEPYFVPNLRISATYFNISYIDRLGAPDSSGGFAALTDPSSFLSLYTVNPSVELVNEMISGSNFFFSTESIDATDPAAIAALPNVVALDNRIQNIAESDIDGIDFSVDYSRTVPFGDLTFGANATYILDSTIVPVLNAPKVTTFNTVMNPVDFRGRAFLGLNRDGFNGQVNVNYYDDYKNTFVTPERTVHSWTTVDLMASYDLGVQKSPYLSNLVLTFSVNNLFNQDPPFVSLSDALNTALNEPVGFDPANSNPTGRFATFGLKKKW